MPFWSRKKTPEHRADPSGLASPEQWMFDALGGPATPSGQRVTVERALGLVPVWAAVRIISEQIAMLPLKVYRDVDGEKVEAKASHRWRLLHDMPNSNTPAGRFWATCSVHLLLWGNAFVLKRRDPEGTVEELFLLKPEEITVLWNPRTGEKHFRHVPRDIGMKQEMYDETEVLHIFGLSLDGIVGESVISHCAAAIGSALARDQYEGNFYNRGATMSGVLETKGVLSDQARQNLVGSFATGYAGANSEKAGGTPLLEEDVHFVPITSPMRDMEFVAAQQLTRTDIAVMFQLPPNALGGSSGDSLTYSTVELEQQHIALHAVAPITTTMAQFLSHDSGILPQTIFSCEFLLDAMMRADSKTRAEVYTAGLDPIKGWMRREEVRARENLAPNDDSASLEAVPTPAQITAASGNGSA